MLAFVTGLVPCPLTTFIMTYALANSLLAAGLVLSGTFALGMIVTVAALPLLVVLLRTRLMPFLARTERLRQRIGRFLEISAAGAVFILGAWPLIQ
jgi:ABC-type nickel/cobalt efflux system permease component RcnA